MINWLLMCFTQLDSRSRELVVVVPNTNPDDIQSCGGTYGIAMYSTVRDMYVFVRPGATPVCLAVRRCCVDGQ